MSDFNLIAINGVYLTSDGTSGGRPCKTKVTGIEALLNTYMGQVQLAIDNTPYIQVTQPTGAGIGENIRIEIFKLGADTLADIQDEINSALDGNDTLNVTIDGTPGNFDIECLPTLPNAIQWAGEQDDTYLFGVTIVLTIADINTTP